MRKLFSRLNNRESGDTLVEVLVAIAILAVILVGAYVTANRSTLSERDAQEHTEALTIAQTQVEDLYRVGSNGLTAGSACFDNNDAPEPATDCFVANNDILAGPKSVAVPPRNVQCLANGPTNLPPAVSGQTAYYYQVCITPMQPDTITVGNGQASNTIPLITFTVTVTWPSVLGGNGQVILNYRAPTITTGPST